MSKTTALLERMMWLWSLLLLISVGQLLWWALDRSPPFHLGSYTSTSAKPGQTATITANVKRDLHRRCSVQFSRYLFDPGGVRHDLVAGQFMTAQALEDMDARSPGKLNLAVVVPESSPSGLAHLFTTLEYYCNPIHKLAWPIEVTIELDFIVEPR